jgi:hypothetical protein
LIETNITSTTAGDIMMPNSEPCPVYSTAAPVRLTAGRATLTIEPESGGRITSLTLDDREILTQRTVHPDNYGSTFWDAPQSAWNWPPRVTLDSAPYQLDRNGETILLTSAPDPQCGLRFRKRFQPQPQYSRFEIVYTITNIAASPSIDVAAWEVTRVPGGLSFFPSAPANDLPGSRLPVTIDAEGICWYRFDAARLNAGRKLFSAAREGWLAHLGADGLLFVKQFPEVRPGRPAPGQGEVEIWGQEGGIYVELENHGPLTTLAVGQSLDYRVNWYVWPAPAVAESDLVAAVRERLRDLPPVE